MPFGTLQKKNHSAIIVMYASKIEFKSSLTALLLDRSGARVDSVPGHLGLGYRLATIVIKVSDSAGVGHAGYLVRVYNGAGGTGAEWGNATSDASGNTVFYLVEGVYQYQVVKGTYNSGRLPAAGFSVTQGATINFVQTIT